MGKDVLQPFPKMNGSGVWTYMFFLYQFDLGN